MSVLVGSPKAKVIEIGLLVLVLLMVAQFWPINRPYKVNGSCKKDKYVLSAVWKPRVNPFMFTIGWTVNGRDETIVSRRVSPWNGTIEVCAGSDVSMRVQQWSADVRFDCIITRNNVTIDTDSRDTMGSVRCYSTRKTGVVIGQ